MTPRKGPAPGLTARAQRWEPVDIIKALFTEEVARPARSKLATCRKAAGFPTGKTLESVTNVRGQYI